jgi:hypothetical protein
MVALNWRPSGLASPQIACAIVSLMTRSSAGCVVTGVEEAARDEPDSEASQK